MIKKAYILQTVAVFAMMLALEAVAFVNCARALDTIAVIPLVLILPGWSILNAFRREIGLISIAEGLTYALLISLGISVFGGLILNSLSSLSRNNWLLFTGTVTAAASLIALYRLQGFNESRIQPSESQFGMRTTKTTMSFVLAALIILGGTLSISIINANDTKERFAQLWLIPSDRSTKLVSKAELGVRNEEGRTMGFHLTIYGDGSKAPVTEAFTLSNGSYWTMIVHRPSHSQLRATLAVDGQRRKAQFVTLAPLGLKGS